MNHQTSLNYRSIRPQYHSRISHLSLNLRSYSDNDQPLVKSIEYLLTHLTQLKSLHLFIQLSPFALGEILEKPETVGEWIFRVGQLTKIASDSLEVRVGLDHLLFDTDLRGEERGARYLQAEKCLKLLLMPEHLFAKQEEARLRSNATRGLQADLADLGYDTETALGYMIVETVDGEYEHKEGEFLLVKD